MAERDIRERDILVATNEYAYVQDLTKGDIVLYVGPTKISLSNTERLVEFRESRFVPARPDEPGAGIHPFVSATSAQYIVLENPPADSEIRPTKGSNHAVELLVGRRIVVAGPATFPLWPGQRAQVIDGHRLREDQYVVVRVVSSENDALGPIGSERVVRGSDVSFYVPETGLEVVRGPQGYVRQARRLRRSAGLHLRVIKPFSSGPGDLLAPGDYEPGQDVFLRDREGFFFPTDLLEVVGEVEGVFLSDKQGLYARDIESGRIDTITGPQSFLPDPTKVEIVTRPVPDWMPGLYGIEGHHPDKALTVTIPPNFAVMVSAPNRREVARGPQVRILDYDEELEVLNLSTGCPKTHDTVLPTCFLQLEGNKVSDVVRVTTADHVGLEVLLSYRVSFLTEGAEQERWFNVRDYVGLLCDHLGSRLRAAGRTVGIEAFHRSGADIVRSALLGDKGEDGRRPGRHFAENDMWVYDVEVLDIRILDAEIEALLTDAQRIAIGVEIERRKEELRLSREQLTERVEVELCDAQTRTALARAKLEVAKTELELRRAEAHSRVERIRCVEGARSSAEARAVQLATDREDRAHRQTQDLELLDARVQAFEKQMSALHPELIATLTALGNQQLAGQLTEHLAPLAILGGESVADVAAKLLAGLPTGPQSTTVERIVSAWSTNGQAVPPPE